MKEFGIMKYNLNKNNSKKLLIGASILFCIVILIIGGSFAFFTQSSSETTGNIVSVEQVYILLKVMLSTILWEIVLILI